MTTEEARVEYGVRFIPPHRNADECIWLPDLSQVACFVIDGMAEAVVRRVGPWERKPCTRHHEDLDCRGLCGLVQQPDSTIRPAAPRDGGES